jgi:hypothetical protein
MKILVLVASLIFHASPAFACGWALITAPGTKWDTPLNEWYHAMSFDRADQCEGVKDRQHQRIEGTKDIAALERITFGVRCVPTDWIAPHVKK